MRVAVVARAVFPLHGYGGLERSVYDLTRALAGRGVDVTLITPPPKDQPGADPSSIHSAIDLDFVPYRTFPLAGRRGTTVLDRSTAYPLWGRRAGRRALELVRAGRIDLVHGFGASVLGYAAARGRGVASAPLVLNPQGLEEFGATDPSRAPIKRAAYLPLRRAVAACAAAADAVIATDRALEPFVLRHLDIAPDRMRTIPNAIDVPALDAITDAALAARLRDAHGVRSGERILLSVGRLEENKGFHVLLRALAAVRDHGAVDGAWRWIVLGDGPYRSVLESLAAELALAPHVRFLGRVSDAEMHGWHEVSTLFVHPTLYEGSSLVTLEAMAHRRPVVASAAGGIPDKIRPGENGWLVPPGDPAALAAAISGAMAGDPARLAQFGNAGRAIVEREFSWSAAGDATVALYEQLLG